MRLDEQIQMLTTWQKARLLSGVGFWNTYSAEHAGIPSIKVADGPQGLRVKNDGKETAVYDSVEATCFPAACALACSFDEELVFKVGQAIAREAAAQDVDVLLAPAVNIKRSVLCGRNFEYYSEDPYQSGQIGTAFVQGVQSAHVGVSVKHFALNGQETCRMGLNTIVDERTLREIYLTAFETIVKQADPLTIMSAYNKVNDEPCSSNFYLLTNILREEWGFGGVVMSDWGAVTNIVAAVKGGLDLQMPDSSAESTDEIVAAIGSGTLTMEELDRAVINIVRLVRKCVKNRQNREKEFSKEEHSLLARTAAAQSGVLAENKGALPLAEEEKILVVGEMAVNPRYQGNGSSHVNNSFTADVLTELKERKVAFEFAKGYHLKKNKPNGKLVRQALAKSKNADKIVIFAGLPDFCESEGFDRKHMRLPKNQIGLIELLVKTNKPVVLVLFCGSAVEIPVREKLNAVLIMHLSGQAVGQAACDLLYGNVNPCGKLAQTWPCTLADTPDYNYFGKPDGVELREGILVGYKYYQFYNKDVAYPFGHGLSYTKFKYSGLMQESILIDDDEELNLSFRITNSGKTTGSEIVQLYVRMPQKSNVLHPVRQLRAFSKVTLKPRKTETVSFVLKKRDFAFYDPMHFDWVAESGEYEIEIGSSSADLRLKTKVELHGKTVSRNDRKTLNEFFRQKHETFTISDRQFEELLLRKIPPKPPLPARGSLTMDSKLDDLCRVSFRARLTRFVLCMAIRLMNLGKKSGALVKMQLLGVRETPVKSLPALTGGMLSVKFVAKLFQAANRTKQKKYKTMLVSNPITDSLDTDCLDIGNLVKEFNAEDWENKLPKVEPIEEDVGIAENRVIAENTETAAASAAVVGIEAIKIGDDAGKKDTKTLVAAVDLEQTENEAGVMKAGSAGVELVSTESTADKLQQPGSPAEAKTEETVNQQETNVEKTQQLSEDTKN